jgi:hypothetical protein
MPKHWNEANNVRFGKKADIRQTKTPAQLPGVSLFATTARPPFNVVHSIPRGQPRGFTILYPRMDTT